ncbi:DEAD/DEAH box helicase [Sediminibacterium sp. TEGAF015]|uniref:DEAD/DEAH box helicase n=1 Tax=Sediminibacterium sp. TEGAF015 TaxID=575378 RepID=UPI002207006C|nr:DEAD/DEAH box helicase [Sediminibacterium sp. TEGAF015]BDQ11206.1 helicase [Sediminibacterium sp. TEGAF015]
MKASVTKQTVLHKLGIDNFNEMQHATSSAFETAEGILLLSPTGSGKTLAFLFPILQQLNPKGSKVQALVLTPSRELAIQIEQVWKKMQTGFKVICAYGGHDMPSEINSLKEAPALLVGTPGRIADHLKRKSFDASAIRYFVFDEFDKSLALGFEEDMEYITKQVRPAALRVFVSATASIVIPEFATPKNLTVLNFLKQEAAVPAVEMLTVWSDDKDKVKTLFELLCTIGTEQVLIFCNHRESVERTSSLLKEMGIEAGIFHGGMEQMQREQALIKFRNGTTQFLVTTDLAARGLDIPDIDHIVHYHLPSTFAEFTHRNGRTARMNKTGTIYLILHESESIPNYVGEAPPSFALTEKYKVPKPSAWGTVYINAGKKEKINKVDIVGFFLQKGKLEKDDIGLIIVKDHNSFIAIRKKAIPSLLKLVRDEKLKGKKFLIMEAR